MSNFPNSSRLQEGALVGVDPANPLASATMFRSADPDALARDIDRIQVLLWIAEETHATVEMLDHAGTLARLTTKHWLGLEDLLSQGRSTQRRRALGSLAKYKEAIVNILLSVGQDSISWSNAK